MYAAVAAFWQPDQNTCADASGTPGQSCWGVLADSLTSGFPGAGKANVVVCGDESWATAVSQGNKDAITALTQATGCTALGYVAVRTAVKQPDGTMSYEPRDAGTVSDLTTAWMQNYAVDGIYFDNAVLPGYEIQTAKDRVSDFRGDHGTATLMVLAGMCADEWVISGAGAGGPDLALLWEDTQAAYEAHFGPSTNTAETVDVVIPDWWKDPANQSKIVHTVHTTTAPDGWQQVVGLAVERNAGSLFLLDTNGPYNHLPPYWPGATPWMNSYNNHSVGPQSFQLFAAAHLWAAQKGLVHGWPNGEQAFYGGSAPANQVRGTYTLNAPATGFQIKTVALNGNPPLYNVSAVWAAAHTWAQSQGLLTAWPTFTDKGAGQYEVVAVPANLPWIKIGTVSNTYQEPTFAEPYALIRNIHRAARSAGYEAGLPTFQADADDLTGRTFGGQTGAYQAALIDLGAPVTSQDVAGTDYGNLV